MKINYGNENKINYGNFENIDFEDIDLEITHNNTLLPFHCLAKNLIPEDTISII